MKNRKGLTFIEFLLWIATLFALIGIFSHLKSIKDYKGIGLNIDQPTVGRVYLVKAADIETSTVIAMPYKFCKNDTAKTNRRFLLKVENQNVCSNGVWFTKTKGGKEVVISSPIEPVPPERTMYY